MGGGGGGSDTNYSEVEQRTTNLPEYAEPYIKDLFARSAFESSQPYEQYGSQRMADFSPMEQEAMARAGELGMSGTSAEMNEAGRMAANLGNTQGYNSYGQAGSPSGANYNPTSRDSGYSAGQRDMGFEAGTMSGEALDPYKDQYMQEVVDIQKREASRQGDIRNAATGLDAAGMGGLGGMREAIMRSEAERNLMQQTGDIQAQGSQQAFYNAQQAYEADRQARGMEEQFGQGQFGMNEGARQQQEAMEQGQFGMNSQNSQFGANLELEKYNAYEQAKQQAAALGLDAQQLTQRGQEAGAGMLGDFASQRQQMEMERLGLMERAGQQQRGMQQAGLDTAYQDFINQQSYGKEQASWLANILYGGQIKPGETMATYGNEPSSMQQGIGAGIAGLGLYNSMNPNGWGG
jgi:hypothetical protein